MERALRQLYRTSRWWGHIAEIDFFGVSGCFAWCCGNAIFAMVRAIFVA
jgi:hypothetical protein